MNKAVFLSLSIVTIWAITVYSGVSDSLMEFLLVGAVPGTSFVISPNIMLLAIGAITWVILFNLVALKAIAFITSSRLVNRHLARNHRMPKRRYSRI